MTHRCAVLCLLKDITVCTNESIVQFDNFKARTCLLCIHVYMLVWKGSCRLALIGEHVLLEVELALCLVCHVMQIKHPWHWTSVCVAVILVCV